MREDAAGDDMSEDDRVERVPGVKGFRFMGSASFGLVGALMERLGRRNPIDEFDPEAFQHGAYGKPEARERSESEDHPDEH